VTLFNFRTDYFVQTMHALPTITPLKRSYQTDKRGTSSPEGTGSWMTAEEAQSSQRSRVTRKNIKASGGDRNHRLHSEPKRLNPPQFASMRS